MITLEEAQYFKSRFNPEGSDLRKQQLIMLDMLAKFDSFCKKHGLKYWMSSGTLLGAVRHGGFIPWDDDLDIEMMKDQYKKLENLRNELYIETGLLLQDHSSDPEYIAPYPKLRDLYSELFEIHNNDVHYKYKGIYIDIFIRERTSKLTSFISHGCQYFSYKFTRINNDYLRRFFKNILWRSMHCCIFPILKLIDSILNHTFKYRYTLGSGFYDYVTYEEIFPLKKIKFEDLEFFAPQNENKYLNQMYGDFMQLPDLDNLHPHYCKIIFKSHEN